MPDLGSVRSIEGMNYFSQFDLAEQTKGYREKRRARPANGFFGLCKAFGALPPWPQLLAWTPS